MIANSLQQARNRQNTSTDPLKLLGGFDILEDSIYVHKPLVSLLFDQLPRLLMFSQIYDMVPRWNQRPDYCSYDIYETTNLAWLVLFVNSCPSPMHFTQRSYRYVYAPTMGTILDVINYIRENKKKVLR